MFECPHQNSLCPAQGDQFINSVDTVIICSIKCPFHLLYCAKCKSLYKVSVLNHNCNVIKYKRTILSVFKYYFNNSTPNHSHRDVFLRTNSYIKSFEDNVKISYDMFMSVRLIKPLYTAFSLDDFFNVKMQLKV